MSKPFSITRRVQVAQTDFAGKMHFAVFFVFMEECLHEYLRSLGISVDYTRTGYAWPRVEADCKYLRPLAFDDEVEISAAITQVDDKVVHIAFTFRRTDEEKVAARGKLVIACCTAAADGRIAAISIPADFRAKLP